jgi:hypothetical protein
MGAILSKSLKLFREMRKRRNQTGIRIFVKHSLERTNELLEGKKLAAEDYEKQLK